MRNYSFRKMTREDLPMVGRWLATAHVRAWWEDAERRLALMEQTMDSDRIDMRVVELVQHPFAYIHDHDVRAFGHVQFADLPAGARVIETFVGNPDYAGQGHASAYIAARLAQLRRNYPMAAIGPSATNTRAIAVYTAAGFRKRRLAPTADGRLVQVMTHP